MLEIITGSVSLDLATDTSITLVFDNPIFEAGMIPTPYSLTYNLPLTPKNLTALGNPHRVASTTDFATKIPIKIMFGGLEIVSGVQTIESVSRDAIEVSFNAIDMPNTSKLHLQNLPLDRLDFGNAVLRTRTDPKTGAIIKRWDSSDVEARYVGAMLYPTQQSTPDYVAATLSIQGSILTGPEAHIMRPGGFINQRTMRINNYYSGYGRAKIIPAISVRCILKSVIPQLGGIFNNGDMARLMVVCSYHPKYQIGNDAHVWDIDTTTGAISLKLADFLPDIPFDDFLCEILKLQCSSIFIVNGEVVIESNSDILHRTDSVSWSDKIIGTPIISRIEGLSYRVGYSGIDTDDPLSDEQEIWEANTPATMIESSILTSEAPIYDGDIIRTNKTMQVYSANVNEMLSRGNLAHYDYDLVGDSLELEDTEGQDDERASFDMTFNWSPVRMCIAVNVQRDALMVPSFGPLFNSKHQYIYCPEIKIDSEPEKKRPTKLTIGIWQGMQPSFGFIGTTSFSYPCISRYNFAADGTRVCDMSLCWQGDDGLLARYHDVYRAWIERDKRSLKVDVLLTNIDLHKLDLRRKVHVMGRNFMIKELSVTLKVRSIEVAEAELVEE